jgi:hypothetical protein
MIAITVALLALGLVLDASNIRFSVRRALGHQGRSAFILFPVLFYVVAGVLWHVRTPDFNLRWAFAGAFALHFLLAFGVSLLIVFLRGGPKPR